MLGWFTKQEVRLHMKSGEVIYFFAPQVYREYSTASGDLTKLSTDGSRGYPLYLRLDHVSAVTTHQVPFWKGLA